MRLIPFLVLFMVPFIFCGQNKDCARFKSGVFKFYEDHKTYYIKRKGNKQVEYGTGMKRKKMKIQWTDNCTYVILPDKKENKRLGLPANARITGYITATTDSSCSVSVTSNFSARVERIEMIKVK